MTEFASGEKASQKTSVCDAVNMTEFALGKKASQKRIIAIKKTMMEPCETEKPS